MAFAQVTLTNNLSRAVSLGPVKIEVVNYTAISADTTGTVTSKYLHEIDAVIVDGLQCSAQVISNTYPAASVALTFTAVPVTGAAGTIILIGK